MGLHLRSSDGEIVNVKAQVAMRMMFVKDMVEDIQIEDAMEIPMSNIQGDVLKKIIEYCQFEQDVEDRKITFTQFSDFENSFAALKTPFLFKMMMASHFVSLRGMFDLTCKIIADKIKDPALEDIQKRIPSSH